MTRLGFRKSDGAIVWREVAAREDRAYLGTGVCPECGSFTKTTGHMAFCSRGREELMAVIGRRIGDEVEKELPAQGGLAPADPWVHRSSGMRCRTCMFYARKESDRPTMAEVGRCRRHAPTMGGYPAVFPSDWCGDHKLDETKV